MKTLWKGWRGVGVGGSHWWRWVAGFLIFPPIFSIQPSKSQLIKSVVLPRVPPIQLPGQRMLDLRAPQHIPQNRLGLVQQALVSLSRSGVGFASQDDFAVAAVVP